MNERIRVILWIDIESDPQRPDPNKADRWWVFERLFPYLQKLRLRMSDTTGEVARKRRFAVAINVSEIKRAHERLSFFRPQLFGGEGILQTSTIFTAKALLQIVSFRRESQCPDDIDWALRATTLSDVGVQFVPYNSPLAILHRYDNRSTISSITNWRFSLDWVN